MTVEAFKQQLAALGAEYRRTLPAKLDEIDALWRNLASGAAAPARLVDLQRALHTIAGTARTLGVAGVSEAAAAAEAAVEPHAGRGKLPPAAGRKKLEDLLAALRASAPPP